MDLVPSRDRQALVRHRVCPKCGIRKPLNKECFAVKISRKKGFRGICLKCEKKGM